MRTSVKRTKALEIAHALKREYALGFGVAQKEAWKVVRAIELMEMGVVKLSFFKKSNERRTTRRATLQKSFSSYQVKGTKRSKNPLQVHFIDLNDSGKGFWKSFNAGYFLSVA